MRWIVLLVFGSLGVASLVYGIFLFTSRHALVLTPHPDAVRGLGHGARIGNREEI